MRLQDSPAAPSLQTPGSPSEVRRPYVACPATPPAPVAVDRVVLSLPAAPEVKALPPPHSAVADQLKEWGREHMAGWGVLLTPPEGRVSRDVAKARGYIAKMVDRLAGNRLKQEKINLVVNIYSGRQINASATCYKEPEKNQGLIARSLGFDGSGRPVYELAVNSGTLRQLQSEEELAFVLGHELSHLFEHHLDPTVKLEPAARWLAGQADEATADQKGIEMMVAAGYDPEGALGLLNRLFKKEKPDGTNAILLGLESAASEHHHEGVRLSLAQGKIELMRRTDSRARPTGELHPLPDFLRLHVNPRDRAAESRMAEVTRDVSAITRKYLLGKPGLPWINVIKGSYATPFFTPPDLREFCDKFYCLNKEQLSDVFKAGLDAVKASDADPQEKVDAVLRLFTFIYTAWNTLPELDPQTKDDLALFFQKNTGGSNGWKVDRFLQKLATDAPGWIDGAEKPRHPYQKFAYDVLMDPALGDVVANLAKVDDQWRRLMHQVPEMLLVDRDSGKADDLNWVADLVNELTRSDDEGVHPGPLRDALKATTLEFFQKADLTRWIEQIDDKGVGLVDTFGRMDFYWVLSKLFDSGVKSVDEDFSARIRAALQPKVDAFLAFREKHTLGWLTGSADSHMLHGSFRDLFDSARLFPFSPEFKAKLEPALLAFIRRANHEKGVIYFPSDLDATDVGLEEFGHMLADMLAAPQVTAADKQEIFDFLRANHKADKALRKSGLAGQAEHEIAGWLACQDTSRMLSMLEQPDYGQYDEAFSRDLGLRWGMPPVPTTNDGLAELARRCDAGDFCVKIEKGTDGQPRNVKFQHDIMDYLGATRDSTRDLLCISWHDQNRLLSPLTFLGADRQVSAQVAARMTFADLRDILAAIDSNHKRFELAHRASAGLVDPATLSTDAETFLLDVLTHTQCQATDLDDWYDVACRTIDQNPAGIVGRLEFKDQLEGFLVSRLEKLSPEKLFEWLGKKHVLDLLGPENMARLLIQTVDLKQPLAAQVKRLDDGLKLRKDYPQGYELFRDRLAEAAHLQPGDLGAVFGPDGKRVDPQENVVSAGIRGLSALVALTRKRSVAEQIDMIEYLMGRRADMPDFLLEVTQQADTVAPLTELVSDARTQLQHSETAVRVMVANSFLAGPSSFVRDPAGLDELLKYMLGEVKPEHQELAQRLARALLDSQGSTDSLALAYVLGQPSEASDGKLSETAVLNNLFDAYGVPGIKFKQYLAFTSEFAEFRESFEASQDSAMPLNYYQAARLVNDRFHGQWPKDLKIDKIMGSGSVNVAIRYHNPATNRDEVIAIARKDIETATDYDFIRFKKFLTSLNQTDEDRRKFGYLLGLADIVHDSVTLEFDKAAALKMQHGVQALYRRDVGDWHIRSIDAFKQENMAVFMEEAKGVTARKLRGQDPDAYRSAMRAMGEVELDALLGIDQHGSPHPVPLHANPDFHDGQVLVDTRTRDVTILDFGQAVPITNEEREYGIDMLEVIGHARGPKGSLTLLQRRCPSLTADDLAPILDRTDRMDAFVHLLSLMNRNGAKVPIAVVHWVLAINRQIALGEKTGVPVDKMIRHLVATRRLGGSLALYNRFHLLAERARAVAFSLVPGALARAAC